MNETVQAAFISSGFGLVGILAGLIVPRLHRQSRTLRAQDAVLSEVRDQVSNDHGSNLRDDMDFIRDVMLETRTDVAWLRREQLDQARRLTIMEERGVG